MDKTRKNGHIDRNSNVTFKLFASKFAFGGVVEKCDFTKTIFDTLIHIVHVN